METLKTKTIRCDYCDEELELTEEEAAELRTGKYLPFCSDECARKLHEAFAKGW